MILFIYVFFLTKKKIRLWRIGSGECDKVLVGHQFQVLALEIVGSASWNRKRLASASADRTIRIWDWSAGKCLMTLTGHTDWVNCAISSFI